MKRHFILSKIRICSFFGLSDVACFEGYDLDPGSEEKRRAGDIRDVNVCAFTSYAIVF
jgi:hypothetical protein